jgi:hypothetical protein
MKIVERQEQIMRIKAASFQAELNEALENQLRQEVMATVQTTLEASLVEEVEDELAAMGKPPRVVQAIIGAAWIHSMGESKR